MPRRSLSEQLDAAVQVMIASPGASLPLVDAGVTPLLRLASELRDLPRSNFKARLKTDFERKSFMATTTEPMAAVRTVAVPRVTFNDAAKAISFYEKAFGAQEIMRFDTGQGIPHAEIKIGDSVIMLTEEWPEGGRFSAETLGNSPITISVDVPDVDSFVERAVAAGAVLTIPVRDQFYGHRDATVQDPFGYVWNVFTRTEEMSAEEMHRRMNAMRGGSNEPAVNPIPAGYHTITPYIVVQDAPGLIELVTKAFAGEETFRTIGGAGGIHAEVRLGDSMLMIGGGGPGLAWSGKSWNTALHTYVENVDAAYRGALAAGAVAVDAPRDQEYGERSATVKDAFGNYWYIATAHGAKYIPEGLRSVNVYLHPARAPQVIDFLRRAFGAKEMFRAQSPDGIVQHAAIRIGDSILEMGEAHGQYQTMATMFYLYVPDVDTLYEQAIRAGGTSLASPKDQPYGDRTAGINDPFGNCWYLATHVKDMA